MRVLLPGTRAPVLRAPLDLEVNAGERVLIVGASGVTRGSHAMLRICRFCNAVALSSAESRRIIIGSEPFLICSRHKACWHCGVREVGKTAVLRALLGLWPAESAQRHLPDRTLVLPQRPSPRSSGLAGGWKSGSDRQS